MRDNIGIGEFFAEAFALCRECLGQVALYVLLLTIILLAFQYGIEAGYRSTEFGTWQFTSAITGFVIGYVLLMIALTCVMAVAMLNRRGESAVFSRCLLPYIGLAIISGSGLLIGFLLLVVPGLILWTRWVAAPGYVLGRGTGVIDGLSKSWDLTSGKGWHIFAGLIVINGVSLLASTQVDAVAVAASKPVEIALSALSGLISNASGALSTAFGIAVFSLLDRNTNRTADVFA